MEYPKAVMRQQELIKMGFPKKMLLRAFTTPGQTFAWKMNPNKRNSPIVFDTAEFERWKVMQAKISQELYYDK